MSEIVEPKFHRWEIAAREHRRHEGRRGRRHAYDTLVAARTALVVIDMVPFFVEANPYAKGIVANVNLLAAALREGGGTIAFVVPSSDLPVDEEFLGPTIASAYRASGGHGAIADRLSHGLHVDGADLLVEKRAPSAFFPGHCDLDARLREREIDTVLIAGTVANVCCESSARDASTLGYRVVMVADANAAGTDDELNATLHTVYRSFGDVRPATDILALLEG